MIQKNKILNYFKNQFSSILYKSEITRIKKIRIPKNCILCECWVFFKIPICQKCRKFLYVRYKNFFHHQVSIHSHNCHYLWEWNLETDFWVQKIVISLKDGYNFEVYKLLMSWLLKKIGHLNNVDTIVAVPSLSRCHPEKLIEAVQFYESNKTKIVLVKKDIKMQKNKSRIERLQTSFSISERYLGLKNIKNKRVVVFDDVLSTGGSFLGVKKALNGAQVECIAVWAYRPDLKL